MDTNLDNNEQSIWKSVITYCTEINNLVSETILKAT